MMHLTGQMGVPVIVIEDQLAVGFSRPRLARLIAAVGNGSCRTAHFRTGRQLLEHWF